MSEHGPQSSEHLPKVEGHEALAQPKSPEKRAELLEHDAKQRAEHLEAARSKLEKHPEPQAAKTESPKEGAPVVPTKFDKLMAYRHTMKSLQRRLPTFSAGFSKVIHSPTVEKASEVVGATIARPSVTLGATTTAAIVGGVMYWAAKSYGFALSGSEILLSMLLGGIVGFLIELAFKAFGRRAS
jgi:hypothetical protein